MNRSLKSIALAGGILAVLITCGLIFFYVHFHIPHFEVVTEGVLYRSGQPNLGDLKRLRDRYGIRTVVNLRRLDEQTGRKGPSLEEERREAERLGLRFIHFPMDIEQQVDQDTVRQWLDLIRQEAVRPILVHCKAGVERTGLLVALYRMEVEGWSPRRALDEAVHMRFEPEEEKHVAEFILSYPKSLTTQASPPTAPSTRPSSHPR